MQSSWEDRAGGLTFREVFGKKKGILHFNRKIEVNVYICWWEGKADQIWWVLISQSSIRQGHVLKWSTIFQTSILCPQSVLLSTSYINFAQVQFSSYLLQCLHRILRIFFFLIRVNFPIWLLPASSSSCLFLIILTEIPSLQTSPWAKSSQTPVFEKFYWNSVTSIPLMYRLWLLSHFSGRV